jgi:hypothetical protein
MNTNTTSIVRPAMALTGAPKIESAVTFIHASSGLAKV